MIDSMNALNGLQAALIARAVQLQHGTLHPDIRVLLDYPNRIPRFTYAQIQGGNVQAIALMVKADAVHGMPCFQIGYAVAENQRGQGLGTQTLQKAISEFIYGMGRTPLKEFYLEVIVSTENTASNKIARRLISQSPNLCNDEFTNEPAYQYLRKMRCSG